jgi:hypothetical protein
VQNASVRPIPRRVCQGTRTPECSLFVGYVFEDLNKAFLRELSQKLNGGLAVCVVEAVAAVV